MVFSTMPYCCGVREIGGLSGYEERTGRRKTNEQHMADMWTQMYQTSEDYPVGQVNWRYAIFTQANHPIALGKAVYGEDFAAYIRTNNLGNVIETEGDHKNPNTGNWVKVWVWTVNHDTTRPLAEAAYQKQPKPVAKPRGKAVPLAANPVPINVNPPTIPSVAGDPISRPPSESQARFQEGER